MVQSAYQYVEAYRFGRASKISGYDKMTFFGNFGHFWLKIEPLCFRNLTQNPWDYKTRAQELTSGAIRMSLSVFVKIWELFIDRRVWGLFYQMNLVVIFVCIIGLLPFWNLTKNPWDYKTRAQELISGAICTFLSSFVKIWEHFKDGRIRIPFFAIFESTN